MSSAASQLVQHTLQTNFIHRKNIKKTHTLKANDKMQKSKVQCAPHCEYMVERSYSECLLNIMFYVTS